jgi:hypothetical protein
VRKAGSRKESVPYPLGSVNFRPAGPVIIFYDSGILPIYIIQHYYFAKVITFVNSNLLIFSPFRGIVQRDVRGVESKLNRSELINCLVALDPFF